MASRSKYQELLGAATAAAVQASWPGIARGVASSPSRTCTEACGSLACGSLPPSGAVGGAALRGHPSACVGVGWGGTKAQPGGQVALRP